jgi:hypothetical protein
MTDDEIMSNFQVTNEPLASNTALKACSRRGASLFAAAHALGPHQLEAVEISESAVL